MKSNNDLRRNNGREYRYKSPSVEVPVTTVIERLNTPAGPELELTTRTTPAIAKARASGYIYTKYYGLALIGGLSDTAMRLAVSQDGRGREDMISALNAGGSLPAEYYGGSNLTYQDGNSTYTEDRWPTTGSATRTPSAR